MPLKVASGSLLRASWHREKLPDGEPSFVLPSESYLGSRAPAQNSALRGAPRRGEGFTFRCSGDDVLGRRDHRGTVSAW